MGIDFCIISLYSIQAKLKYKDKKKTATAVFRFEVVHVGVFKVPAAEC